MQHSRSKPVICSYLALFVKVGLISGRKVVFDPNVIIRGPGRFEGRIIKFLTLFLGGLKIYNNAAFEKQTVICSYLALFVKTGLISGRKVVFDPDVRITLIEQWNVEGPC